MYINSKMLNFIYKKTTTFRSDKLLDITHRPYRIKIR